MKEPKFNRCTVCDGEFERGVIRKVGDSFIRVCGWCGERIRRHRRTDGA
jgi:hypothetical protein